MAKNNTHRRSVKHLLLTKKRKLKRKKRLLLIGCFSHGGTMMLFPYSY